MRSRVISVFLLLVLANTSRADLVVGYSVANNTQPVAPTNGAGVTGVNLSRGAGLGTTGTTDFITNNWNLEATDFIEFGFSAASPTFDLTQLQVRTNRTATGPTSIDVQGSFNGGLFSSVGSFAPAVGATNFTIDLSALDAISSATFRLFGTGSTGTAGTFRIEDDGNFINASDLVVEGVVSAAVPEPTAFLFGGLVCGVIGLCAGARRLLAEPQSDG